MEDFIGLESMDRGGKGGNDEAVLFVLSSADDTSRPTFTQVPISL